MAKSIEHIAADANECTSVIGLEDELNKEIIEAQKSNKKTETEHKATLARIPKKVVDSEVLSYVRRNAVSTRCNLIDFRPNSTQNQKDYKTRSFELRLEGGFKNLYQFSSLLATTW